MIVAEDEITSLVVYETMLTLTHLSTLIESLLKPTIRLETVHDFSDFPLSHLVCQNLTLETEVLGVVITCYMNRKFDEG